MKCIASMQLRCFVLVQLAALVGCSSKESNPPSIYLIIPEHSRGAIDFEQTGDPPILDSRGNLRVEFRKFGGASLPRERLRLPRPSLLQKRSPHRAQIPEKLPSREPFSPSMAYYSCKPTTANHETRHRS
jgi:hypothetical protein